MNRRAYVLLDIFYLNPVSRGRSMNKRKKGLKGEELYLCEQAELFQQMVDSCEHLEYWTLEKFLMV